MWLGWGDIHQVLELIQMLVVKAADFSWCIFMGVWQLTIAKGIQKYQKWSFKALMTLAFKKGGLDLKCLIFRGSNQQRVAPWSISKTNYVILCLGLLVWSCCWFFQEVKKKWEKGVFYNFPIVLWFFPPPLSLWVVRAQPPWPAG